MSRWGRRVRVGARGRLPRPLYELVTRLVPIPCVDVLPLRVEAENVEIGLIERLDAGGEIVWALVGGGIHRGESVGQAAARHIRSTLGPDIDWDDPEYAAPGALGEYFPDPRQGAAHDPRKHAIAVSYVVALRGEVHPQGEATGFRWFAPQDAPLGRIGFGQDAVLCRLLSNIEHGSTGSPAVHPRR